MEEEEREVEEEERGREREVDRVSPVLVSLEDV